MSVGRLTITGHFFRLFRSLFDTVCVVALAGLFISVFMLVFHFETPVGFEVRSVTPVVRCFL